MDLAVQLPRGLRLRNPILAASGTFGFGPEYAAYVDLNRLGGVSVKGISPDPWRGNPPPRVWETAEGLLNSIGLQNPGMEAFLQDDIPFLKTVDTAVVANIIGHTTEEYQRVAARLAEEPRINAFEINISCPNIKEGGIQFGHDPEQAFAVTRAVRQVTDKPLMVKVSPNTAEPWVIAEAAVAAGADMISAINTLVGMAIDLKNRRPALGGRTGGLSGPAIKPVAVRIVYELASRLSVPIIGMGGIQSVEDVLEFLMAGASAVMVGTITFQHPERMVEIIEQLPKVLADYGFASVSDAVGAALPPKEAQV
ncbi:dihydroorotate dehydrogenase [Sulfobacillus harzensis]|uniref:Dihydroorotate dehydrogenase n=1 Tax=Sulfobacillus harzensis TaxID=2729629 RepID=A0A7Y0Q1N5_9FIRM|nr:dihydroorotate dehydrogenase [Sulfobacillus harzensis]NMP21647.1 dihydroorotate dehydrogenase [Sulfobacillus harzensis]